MSTYTLNHQELEQVLRRQAQMIADRAFPLEPPRARDVRAQQWAKEFTPGLLQTIGLKSKEKSHVDRNIHCADPARNPQASVEVKD